MTYIFRCNVFGLLWTNHKRILYLQVAQTSTTFKVANCHLSSNAALQSKHTATQNIVCSVFTHTTKRFEWMGCGRMWLLFCNVWAPMTLLCHDANTVITMFIANAMHSTCAKVVSYVTINYTVRYMIYLMCNVGWLIAAVARIYASCG